MKRHLFWIGLCALTVTQTACNSSQQTERDAITSIDPAYSRTQVVPQTTEVDGAPWLYADTELEAYRHALLFKRMKEAKLRVSYPGKYYAYKDTAWFQWTPEQESNQPAEPSAIVDIYAFGDISITQDWKEIYKGQNQRTPHRVTLDPHKTLLIKLQAPNEPPALRIENGFCSTRDAGWRACSDGTDWNYPCAYAPLQGDSLPHRMETPTLTLQPEQIDGNIYDFGRELFGFVSLTAAEKPELYAGESVAEAQDTVLKHREQSFDLVQVGPNRWRTAHALGFRYLTLQGKGIKDVICDAYTYPAQYRGEFTSSDPLLDQIWMNSAYTLRLCMHEFHLDGVKRDRLPWAGDIATSLMVNAYTFADPEIVRRSIAVLGREGIAETNINNIVDYSLWWLISQDNYQLYFGDTLHLKREWKRIKEMMTVLEQRSDKDGLLLPGNAWLFLDWVDVEKEGALQVLWWWAQQSVANLADRMKEPEMAAYWRDKSDKLKVVLLERGYDAQRGAWRGKLTEESGPNRHANFLAVISGLAPESQYEAIIRTLSDTTVQQVGTPYMMAFEYMALARLGQGEEMLRQMKDYWGGMIEKGATSFWEGYDPKEGPDKMYTFYKRPYGKSLCHGWSSGPAALIPGELLGIRPLADGWKVFSVDPKITSVKNMHAIIPTPQGDIEATLTAGQLSVKIPAGAQAIYQGKTYTESIP